MLVFLDLDALVLRAARPGLPHGGIVVGESVRLEIGFDGVRERQPVNAVHGRSMDDRVCTQLVQGRH